MGAADTPPCVHKTLKILHVIPSTDIRQGGPSTLIRTLTRSLAGAGLEIHVVTTGESGEENLDGVTYRSFRQQNRFYHLSWAPNQWLAQHVKEYALVHIHTLFSFPTTCAAFWSHYCKVPYLVTPHGILNQWGFKNHRQWLKKLSLKWIENRMMANAAAVHYTTEQERQEAVELGAKGKAVMIPNFLEDVQVNNFHSRPLAKLGTGKKFLFLSRFHPKKGLDLLLPAFAQVKHKHPDCVLVLAGAGKSGFVSNLQQEARRLKIDQHIVWAGFLENEEKWMAFAGANVFVLPSYAENFGIAVLEAMACGIPVVISDQVGICSDVREAQAGIIIQIEINQLADAMIRLLDHPEIGKKMGENGRRLVEEKFTAKKVIPQIIELYESVLNLKRNGKP